MDNTQDNDNGFSFELLAGAEAFGSGEHPTTQLTLEAMTGLAAYRKFGHILDMGCGAGLLAMLASRYWPEARITAADISPVAVELAKANIRHNGLEDRITVLRADSYRTTALRKTAPFDLIVSNISADILLQLAGGLPQVMTDDAVVVLSGVLLWRSAEVLAIYERLGLTPLLPVLGIDDWETHVLARQPA